MRKVILSFLLLVFSLYLFAFAQDEQGVPAASRLVTAIEVRGNKAISSNTIVSKMKTRIGSPYQENITSDDLKRLYLLGFFSDIKIDTENFKNGIKVIVTIQERPLIERITFSGIRRITLKDEKLKEQLKSKEGQYLDYPNLDEDLRTLQKIYEKMGFSRAEVKYEVALNKQTNKAQVQFIVTENKKVRIKDIIIEGNRSFSRRRILGLLKTKRAWFFNAGILKEEVFKEDLVRLKAFYQRQGFTDVVLDSSIMPDPKKTYLLYVYLKIEEGKKYLIGNIAIKGNKDISEKDIRSALEACTPDKVFSDEALREDVASIQGLYFDRGYISAQVQETTAVNSVTGRVDVAYNISENEVCFVDKIKIKGNIKTKDVVIRRQLRIRPQDRFDGEKLRRSKERLQNLGFFEEISYDTEDTALSNKKNLVVEVKESKTGAFSFGGGYSTVEQFVGFVEIEQKNFDWRNFPYFTGAGQDIKFRASFGTISSGFNLSFTEPWLFDYPVSFGFDAYSRQHQRESDVGYGYDEQINGGDLRLGRELSEYLRVDATYRLDQIEISNIVENSPEIEKEKGKNIISSLTPAVSFDSRDNIFDTKKGDLLIGSLELAGGPFGGDKDFWKFFGRASHYFPLFANSSLELRGRLGLSAPYGDSERIALYERFFAGGADSIRGYDERKIGPIDSSGEPLGGNSLLLGNIEYTYPLFNFLKGAAFFDTGNVWGKLSKFGSSSPKSSFGLGVRIKTPIGPIMLDYGIPLNKAPGEEKRGRGKIHFSASHGF